VTEWLYNTRLVQSFLAGLRKKRAAFVLSRVGASQGMSILDVGCGSDGRSFENFVPENSKIVGVDILAEETIRIGHPRFEYLRQSAQDLSMFRDGQFDLAVSFGMMEHICDSAMLGRIYSEVDRVARHWVVVVPWRYAFVEPHFKFPYFQLLPYPLKVFLTRILNLDGLRRKVTEDYDYIRSHYWWLTNREWTGIFKGGRCHVIPPGIMVAIIKCNHRDGCA
jgi:SAM-dependent methyltransferase